MSDLVISLSTIPPRMNEIQNTLQGLLDQDVNVAEIRLNIPKKYRRFEFNPSDIPAMPSGINVCLVEEDIGPATKILPTAADLLGQDVNIIFCDDDQFYPPFWASSMLQAQQENPDACICRIGYDFSQRPKLWVADPITSPLPRMEERVKNLQYRMIRATSLGFYKPSYILKSGYAQIFEGYGGVLIRPDMIPESAYNLPDHLLAVDDPLLSGFIQSNGVPIWVQAEPNWRPHQFPIANVERLAHLSVGNKNRVDLDSSAIQFCQETLGVFEGATPIFGGTRTKTQREIDTF